MKTHDFFYDLPQELIAQTPLDPRDRSRMLVCNRENRLRAHRHFFDLPAYLKPGDAVVINHTKVIPARLIGQKEDSGIPCEVLLLKRLDQDNWEALVRPGRRLKTGSVISFGDGMLRAVIKGSTDFGGRIVEFIYQGVFEQILDQLGQMPLPPYIHEKLLDPERYQTVYASVTGSAAAPTAGLHFTPWLIENLEEKGIKFARVTLHVGLDTFAPVTEEDPLEHRIHTEWCELDELTADLINNTKATGGRVIAVGTTSVRTLESALCGTTSLRTMETVSDEKGIIYPGKGMTGIFIKPGYQFKACDLLLTNFHLPESTLLMLVSAFMGLENALTPIRRLSRSSIAFSALGTAC